MPNLNEIRSVLRADPFDGVSFEELAREMYDECYSSDGERIVIMLNKRCPNSRYSLRVCEDCDRPSTERDGTMTSHSEWICSGCIEDNYFRCDACGDYSHNSNSSTYHHGQLICDGCKNSGEYSYSYSTESYWPAGERPEDQEDDEEEEEEEDEEDGPRGTRSLIRSYSTNVMECLTAFRFLDDERPPLNPLWLGVELEVERGQTTEDYVEIASEATKDFAILKADSSLGSSGFEIVTVPATLAYHREAWRPFFKDAAKHLRSWNTDGRCGMHVHVSRAAIADLTLGQALVFINNRETEELITRIAGRASTDYAERSRKKVTDVKRERHIHGDALAFTDRNDGKTVELRIFRGNVSQGGFYKNLDFASALFNFCKGAGVRQLTSGHFLTWLDRPQTRAEYPYLSRWASAHGLIKTPARKISPGFASTKSFSYAEA